MSHYVVPPYVADAHTSDRSNRQEKSVTSILERTDMLPSVTHLQFIILGLLNEGTSSGKELREELRRAGVRHSGPSFYQIMARLEDAGLVTGAYKQREVESHVVRERWYELTTPGLEAWRLSSEFYLTWIERVADDPSPA